MRCYNCTSEKYTSKCQECGFSNNNLKLNPSALQPGSILDERYFIGRVLGQGGFGITYVGFDEILGGIVAIKEHFPKAIVQRSTDGKVITNNSNEYKAGLKKFTEEAKAVAKFKNHKNIVSVLSYMTSNNTAYMIMEYIQGRTVKDILAGGKSLPVKDALEVIHQVLDGIGACHSARLIHRDLTPDNIYITTQGSVKILDFGSARETVEGGDNEFTQVLKKSYAPVEQFQQGQGQGPWTDIYSIGASLYRMLLGKPPELNSVDRLLNDTLKSPLESRNLKDWNSELDQALMKAMAVRPDARYQHVDEFKVDLLNAHDSFNRETSSSKKTSLQTAKANKATLQSNADSKPNKALIPSISAVAAAVLLGIFMFTGSEPEKVTYIAQPDRQKLEDSLPKLTKPIQSPTPESIPPPGSAPEKLIEERVIVDNSRPDSPERQPFNEIEINDITPRTGIPELVSITLNPRSAKFFLNNKPINIDNQSIQAQTDEVNIKIIAPGYQTYESNSTITSNKRFTLKPYENPSPALYSELLNYLEAPTTANSKILTNSFAKNYSSYEGLSKLSNLISKDTKVIDELKFLEKNGDAQAKFLLQIYYLSDEILSNDELALQKLDDTKSDYPLSGIFYSTYKGCIIEGIKSCNPAVALNSLPNYPPDVTALVEAMLLVKEGKHKDAENKLKLLANINKNSVYTNLLGEIAYGKGNRDKAIDYFREAATQGDMINTTALINLGIISSNKRDKYKWINDAVNFGSIKAQNIMPYVSFNHNDEAFLSSVKTLMKRDKAEASMLLALHHFTLDQKNTVEINKHLSQCKQDINCKTISALIDPDPVSINALIEDVKSKKLLPGLKIQALSKLGKHYLADDPKRAINYLEEAKNLGSNDALAALCYAYAFVQVEEKKAQQYCELGQNMNDPLVLNSLAHIYTNFKEASQNKSKAQSLLVKSCNLGSGAACCNASKNQKNTSERDKFIAEARQNGILQC